MAKKVIVGVAFLFLCILAAGVVKFDVLSTLEGYDVDGNLLLTDTPLPEVTRNVTDAPDDAQEYDGFRVETSVDAPDECTSFETYDAARGVCFFRCDTEEQCEKIENKIDAELESLGADYGNFSDGLDENAENIGEIEDQAEVIYQIMPGERFEIVSGKENAKDVKVRKWLAEISPDPFSDRHLNRLVLVPDIHDATAAFVLPDSEENLEKWDMVVNMKSLEDGEKEMVFTLIHEFSHILTLNEEQIDETIDEEACRNFYLDEGCVNTNAYLNLFYEKFWKGKGFMPVYSYDDAQDEDKQMDNYDLNPDAFVTYYAATNPVEDIAESFASFVFRPAPQSPQTIAEQKISFFYSFPELVAMRKAMRDVLKVIVHKRLKQFQPE